MMKLKYMKWFAILVHLYFFGTISLLLLQILSHRRIDGLGITGFRMAFLSMEGLFYGAPYILLAALLLIPVFTICSAFKLRNKNRLLMTSRAKDPPLLMHLIQYTSGDDLVQGVLRSLFYTWGRLALMLILPIIATITVLALLFVTGRDRDAAWLVYICLPFILTLFGMTFSIFLVMQGLCFRLDSLVIMIAIIFESGTFLLGILSNFVHSMLSRKLTFGVEFWLPLLIFFVPSCLFACFYFPLAATDTNAYGLGKRVPKWIRAVLFSLSGVFMTLFVVRNVIEHTTGRKIHVMDMVSSLFDMFEVYGLIITVCCLLVTSVSMTSFHAERLSRIRSGDSFLRRIFDPASPLSLIPVFLLEAVSIGVFLWTTGKPDETTNFKLLVLAPLPWAILHFGLLITFTKQRFKQDMKPAWLSHVQFNIICILLSAFTLLCLVFFTKLAIAFSVVDYIVSIVIWCFIVLIEKQYSARRADLGPGCAPAWVQKGKTP
jgi:hypothetical protein